MYVVISRNMCPKLKKGMNISTSQPVESIKFGAHQMYPKKAEEKTNVSKRSPIMKKKIPMSTACRASLTMEVRKKANMIKDDPKRKKVKNMTPKLQFLKAWNPNMSPKQVAKKALMVTRSIEERYCVNQYTAGYIAFVRVCAHSMNYWQKCKPSFP